MGETQFLNYKIADTEPYKLAKKTADIQAGIKRCRRDVSSRGVCHMKAYIYMYITIYI